MQFDLNMILGSIVLEPERMGDVSWHRDGAKHNGAVRRTIEIL